MMAKVQSGDHGIKIWWLGEANQWAVTVRLTIWGHGLDWNGNCCCWVICRQEGEMKFRKRFAINWLAKPSGLLKPMTEVNKMHWQVNIKGELISWDKYRIKVMSTIDCFGSCQYRSWVEKNRIRVMSTSFRSLASLLAPQVHLGNYHRLCI